MYMDSSASIVIYVVSLGIESL